MKKGCISLFLVLMMVFGFSASVSASDTLTVTSTENVFVAPNAEFYVDIKAIGASNLVGFQMMITYDASQFTYEGITKSNALGNNITVNANTAGVLILNYVDVSTLLNGDVELFKITFTANANVNEGSQSVISIDESYNNEFIRYTDTISKIDSVNFTFNPVQRGLYGDVNLDNNVSIMDAAIMQLFIADLTTLTPTQFVLADVNGDGFISVTDVALVQLYLAGLISSLNPS